MLYSSTLLGPSSVSEINSGFPPRNVPSAPHLESPLQPFLQPHSRGTVNPQSLSLLSEPLHRRSNFARLESPSLDSLASQSTQYSHKPEMIVSPERTASVLTKKHGYKEVNKPETPASRESPGPEVLVVASPQGHLAIKGENGYTGYTKTDSMVEAPQRPTQETPGTVHWGSPSPAKPEAKDQLPTRGTASLASTLTGVQLSSQRPLGVGVELGELRRTAPHGDLTQIKSSHGGAQDETRLVPNTSLSVPNIAPSKPEILRPASVQKTASPFSSNSTPQMLFGGIAPKTESTSVSRASGNPTPTGAPSLSTTSSLLMSKTSESVSQTKDTTTFQVSSLSGKDTKQPGAPTTTTSSASLFSNMPSFAPLLNANGASPFLSGLPSFTSSGTPSFSLGSGGSTAKTVTLASKPLFTFNSAQTQPKPPTSSVTPSNTGPSLSIGSGPFVFGSSTSFSLGSSKTTPVSTPVSLPTAPTVSDSSGIFDLLSTKSSDKGDQKFKEVSKAGANGADKMPLSSLVTGDTSGEVHSDTQLKKDQAENDTYKSIPQITKTQQSGLKDQTEPTVKEHDTSQPSAAPPNEPVKEAQLEGAVQHSPTVTGEVTTQDVSSSTVVPTVKPSGKPSSSVAVTEPAQEPLVHVPTTVPPAAITSGSTLRTFLSVPASVSLATSTEKEGSSAVLVGSKVEPTPTNSSEVNDGGDLGASGDGGVDAGGGDVGVSGSGDVGGGDVDAGEHSGVTGYCPTEYVSGEDKLTGEEGVTVDEETMGDTENDMEPVDGVCVCVWGGGGGGVLCSGHGG